MAGRRPTPPRTSAVPKSAVILFRAAWDAPAQRLRSVADTLVQAALTPRAIGARANPTPSVMVYRTARDLEDGEVFVGIDFEVLGAAPEGWADRPLWPCRVGRPSPWGADRYGSVLDGVVASICMNPAATTDDIGGDGVAQRGAEWSVETQRRGDPARRRIELNGRVRSFFDSDLAAPGTAAAFFFRWLDAAALGPSWPHLSDEPL